MEINKQIFIDNNERERERERERDLSSGSRFVMHNFASDTKSANSIRNVQKKRRLI